MNEENTTGFQKKIVVYAKLEFLSKKPLLLLFIIGITGIFFRLLYFPSNIPLVFDAFDYFLYAFEIKNLGYLPLDYTPANNGWPIFLSVFFSLLHFDNALSYMQIQRVLSLIISVITILPLYYLLKLYFSRSSSLVGVTLFCFEPHIIQNSLLGITEPLYILLEVIALFLFFTFNKKTVYLSFATIALATTIRTEGLFLFLLLSILFIIHNRKERFVIPKYLLLVLIFVLILLPNGIYKIEVVGSDPLIARIIKGVADYTAPSSESGGIAEGGTGTYFFLTGIENFPKYLVISLIPLFVFFVPLGAIIIFKKRISFGFTLIFSLFIISIPAFYAYSIPSLDVRYLFFLYPFFCLISLFTIKQFTSKFNNQKIIAVFIIGGILISSSIFFEVKKSDTEFDVEKFEVTKFVVSKANGVNDELPQNYLKTAELIEKWPDLPKRNELGNLVPKLIIIPTKNFESLESYIISSKDKGLTHLVIDEMPNVEFLKNVFYNDKNYPYLEKIYDSSEYDFSYLVKIYKIDYGKADFIKN